MMTGVSRTLMALGFAGMLAIGGSVAAGAEPADVGGEAIAARKEVPTTKKLVNVYWAWDMPTHPNSPERIAAGARWVDPVTPATGAMTKLLKGPNAAETNLGMLTTIPAGTILNGVSINNNNNVATVDLSPEFESGCGALTEVMRLGQVVFTLTQFPNVDRVKFEIDGVPTDPINCHGTHVGAGLDRNDFTSVQSLVMVEYPYPNAPVVNELVVRGESNTFEATVRYILTDRGGDGRIVDEGFTTATNGNGIWGTYEIRIDLDALPTYAPGPGAIIVWDEDMRTGSMGATVEYPIQLPPRCDGRAATILGPPFDHLVTGTVGADVIVSRAGDDVVLAGWGADRVCLGFGDDRARGQRGPDTIRGGWGNDTVFGGTGGDQLLGGAHRDVLLGGNGDDIVDGEDGRDDVSGDLGDDEVTGGSGQDSVFGGDGRDLVLGGGGSDVLTGGTQADEIRGGLGADELRGGFGRDLLFGGPRDDGLFGGFNDDRLDGGLGVDNCDGGLGTDTGTNCETSLRIP